MGDPLGTNRFMRALWILALIATGLVTRGIARGEEPVDYTRQIKPVLQARCLGCHGVLKQKGGLRLDTAALALKGSKSQAVVVPGDPEASVLVERVSSRDESERMPPEGEPLKASEIAALKAFR